MGKVWIGTSGWTYRHWRGRFYPEDLSPKKWLEYYCRFFDTVELNSPFYRIPRRRAFEGWKARTPEGFLFAVKASRLITHVRKLKGTEAELQWFFSEVQGLGEKLGPVLFQTPPSLKADLGLLVDFLKALPPGRYAFEFRHPSWFSPDVYRILEEHGATLCVADSPRFPKEMVVVGPFLYLRLHGSQRLYASLYTREELSRWAEFIRNALGSGAEEAFCYFDNDYEAYAVRNALELKGILVQVRNV